MVHQAVDGGGGGHRLLEDALPFAEDQVAGDHHRAALVALGEEGEEHLHLLPVLLDIPDIIKGHDRIPVQLLEQRFQFQRLLGEQQFLHQLESRNEQHGVAMPQDQLPAQGSHEMTFPTARQAEGEHVLPALHKAAFQQRG